MSLSSFDQKDLSRPLASTQDIFLAKLMPNRWPWIAGLLLPLLFQMAAFYDYLYVPPFSHLFFVISIIIVCGLIELALLALILHPTPLIEVLTTGLRLDVRGPFRSPLFIPWSMVESIF